MSHALFESCIKSLPLLGRGKVRDIYAFDDERLLIVTSDRLSAYGLFHEIISWKLRMFIPTDASGPAILAKVLERYPVQRIGEREAA